MRAHAPSWEELDGLESLVNTAAEGVGDEYRPPLPVVREERASYFSGVRYAQSLWDRLRKPLVRKVAAAMIGLSVMGAYFPSSNVIEMSDDVRFQSEYGLVLRHEEGHAYFMDPTLPHDAEEIRNRTAQYGLTRDSTQLGHGTYHP